MSKKIISILLICCFLTGALAVGVGAAESDAPVWSFDANGQLTVNNASALADYASTQDVPWNLFTSLITTASIDPSISYIGAYSLNNLNATVHIENGNTEIAEHAFDNAGTDFVIVSVFNSPVHTYAKEHGLAFKGIAVASGECGTDAHWSIYDDGTLHIHGSGAMTDYYRDPTSTPWYSYRSTITGVLVDEAITFVSPYTVFSASNCKSATILGAETQVSSTAFQMVHADFTVYGHLGSSAQETAETRGYAFVPFTIASGTCGPNATWALYTNGLLKIDGYGAMESYNDPIKLPYFDYASQITAIEIGEGITKLSKFVYFPGYTKCTSFTIWNPAAIFDALTISLTPSASTFDIRGYSGSTAQKYAEEKSLPFAPCSPILAMGAYGAIGSWQLHENGVLRFYVSDTIISDSSTSWHDYANFIKTVDISKEIAVVSHVIGADEINCTKLIIRNPEARIAPSAIYPPSNKVTIYGEFGSTAEAYAKEKNIPFDSFILGGGSCGANAAWTLYTNGLLKITGSGAMDDSYTAPAKAPWDNCRDEITQIEIGPNITSIARFTYFNQNNCTSVTILNPKATYKSDSITIPHNLTIYGYTGSTAQDLAKEKNIPFVALD